MGFIIVQTTAAEHEVVAEARRVKTLMQLVGA
jgi:hypothetical protein